MQRTTMDILAWILTVPVQMPEEIPKKKKHLKVL